MVTTVTSQATASRRLKPSALQRISEAVLIAGTVGAVAAASGPVWVVRLGVAVAITAALVACAFAWRDINAARHVHAQAMLQAARHHGARLTEERNRNAAVVDALSMRIADAGKVIERQRTRIAQQRLEISSLNQDQACLKGEIEYREKVIAALRDTGREREAELTTSSDEAEAQVHHMPRRVLVGHDFVWQEMPAEDEIVPESLPVVDIKIIDAVLPNYEADRQPA
jgi:outer membrane lipopolysaccharide assembly protein LptE/RlpB